MKLIDKDALVAEIERRYSTNLIGNHSSFRNGKCEALREVLSFINTLEVKEVNLDKSLTGFMGRYAYENGGEYPSAINIAKHFFELGLSVSNSAKVTTPDIEDVLKENGVNPDSKEAKIIKESYYMALERLKAQKGE